MQPTVIGMFVGILLGLAWVLTDFPHMLVVAFLGAIGYVVMRFGPDVDWSQFTGESERRPPRQ